MSAEGIMMKLITPRDFLIEQKHFLKTYSYNTCEEYEVSSRAHLKLLSDLRPVAVNARESEAKYRHTNSDKTIQRV